MSEQNVKIAVIVGSTRPNRVGRTIGDWAIANLPKANGATYDLIDLKEENIPFLNEPESPSTGNYQLESSKRWSEKIRDYDGYIWVTSEYNHGYSAPLKNAIDSLYAEWGKKPVAFVGYGGMGGARAIEQLAQVAAQLNMAPLSSTSHTVRILDVWSAIDENGQIKQEFVRGSFEKLENELVWWATILKQARS